MKPDTPPAGKAPRLLLPDFCRRNGLDLAATQHHIDAGRRHDQRNARWMVNGWRSRCPRRQARSRRTDEKPLDDIWGRPDVYAKALANHIYEQLADRITDDALIVAQEVQSGT